MDQANQSAAARTLRAIGSTWVGVGLIGLIAVYLSLASTVPTALARLLRVELVDLDDAVHTELYRHPLPAALGALLCANLVVATLVRVPRRLASLGAWCSHAGVILLAAGSLWYTARGVSGDNLTVRVRGGWSPIRHVYVRRTLAAYVIGPAASEPVQTPLRHLPPRGEPRELNVPLGGGGDDVTIRATRYLPTARVVTRWRDISPNRVPAVQLRVADGDDLRTVVLSPSLPRHRQLPGRGYAMIYHAGLDARSLAKMIAPADPNSGPGIRHEVALVVTGKDVAPTLVVIRPDGSRWHAALKANEPVDAPLAGRLVRVELLALFAHAAQVHELATKIRPSPDDEGELPPAGPVLRVEVRAGSWRRGTWVPFSAYEHVLPPQLIDLPGNRAVWLSFSRERTPLPATLTVTRAEYQTYPASRIPKDYRCDVEIAAGGSRRIETLSLNHPVHVGAFQFSQGSWRPHASNDPRRIYLIAASRPGLPLVWTGCVLICLGFPIAFYVKPLILRGRGPS